MKGTFIQKGFIVKGLKENLKHFFHLERWLSESLTKFNVPHKDACCNSGLFSAVRYNETTSKLQYFDKDNDTWTDVPNAALNPA
jgi:hypothetical protein